MAETAVKIEHLSKSYGDILAVNDISFSVDSGSLFAFLGVNGAGKSTTINIICSILAKDAGKVYVYGNDIDRDAAKIKRDIGIVFQTSVIDKELTVKENLDIRAAFYGAAKAERKKSVEEIVELLDLGSIYNRPVGKLSGGQQRRVDIARAMVHKPKLLVLDEPTTGLDPKTRLSVWSLIDRIRSETGMTVFLTTHYLEEADKATDVVIMDKGSIIAHGTPVELKNKYSTNRLIGYMESSEALDAALTKNNRNFSYNAERKAYYIDVTDAEDVGSLLGEYKEFFTDIEVIKGSMDDVFLNVTGQKVQAGE